MTAEILIKPEHPCPFCGKNEATQLCDFVVDYAFIITCKMARGGCEPKRVHDTCDNPMCSECATRVSGHEFCPTCTELYEYVRKHHKRRIKFRRDAK